MKTLLPLRTLCATAVFSGMLLFSSPTVSAGDSCHAPRYYYKTVTVYESVREPYRYSYTKHTPCGKRYTAWATGWKTVRVPVHKRVRVHY